MVHSPDAEPVGDLNLKLGSVEDTKYIRISSKILCLSSTVFTAMSRFSEGRALATLSAGSTTTISPPDDDAEAILWLCDALHFNKSITEEMSFELLKKLAVVCDKYDMSKTLSPWIQAWMEKGKGTLGGEDCYTAMVWISNAFRHHAAFWRNTRNLILYSSPKLLEVARNFILPDSITSKYFFIPLVTKFTDRSRDQDFISAECTEALDQLQRTAETIILPHLGHICLAEAQHKSRTDLCEHLRKMDTTCKFFADLACGL
ncbi:hypothetical protein N7G274_009868 [Stereocaulon virgatum]|uniref:BTB domain-containing protein n=1 Tax=Stereocaulon virgatum TaxID=373712 RepID=A0ABR3ZXA9_9LECA